MEAVVEKGVGADSPTIYDMLHCWGSARTAFMGVTGIHEYMEWEPVPYMAMP